MNNRRHTKSEDGVKQYLQCFCRLNNAVKSGTGMPPTHQSSGSQAAMAHPAFIGKHCQAANSSTMLHVLKTFNTLQSITKKASCSSLSSTVGSRFRPAHRYCPPREGGVLSPDCGGPCNKTKMKPSPNTPPTSPCMRPWGWHGLMERKGVTPVLGSPLTL